MVSGLTNYGNGVVAVQTPRSAMFVLRTLGSALLGLSLIIALLRDGPSFGSLLWATAIGLAALVVALILARFER